MDFAFEATPPDPSKNARKRMLRDIIEWNQYSDECPMITAAPMQENIFEWHINMNATSGVLKNIIIHLIATFPADYPRQPPTIRVCSFLPHPNVFAEYYWHWNRHWKWVRDKQHYWICLDMIGRYDSGIARDKQVVTDSYHGWSAAYSVTSVLLQLSSFLYESKSSYHTGKQMRGKKGMKLESQEFACIKCGHSYAAPYPPLSAHRPTKGKQRRFKKREYAQKKKEMALVKKCSKNMWAFLYDDVERLIIAYLSLRDLMKLATLSPYHRKLVSGTKILQIHRFGCWYHRVDLSFHNELLKIRGKFHGWSEAAMTDLKCKSNEANREVYHLTLGYGVIPTFYAGNTSFASHIHSDDLSAMQRAQEALQSINGIGEQCEGKASENEVEGKKNGKKKHIPLINLPYNHAFNCAIKVRDALDFPLLKEVKATFDLLSADAYLNHAIHTTPWNDQSFHNFIPIYVNDKHGARALQCIEEFVLQCYSKHDPNVRSFHPLMAIHLIANIMNTLVVHLMQKFDTDNAEKLAKKGQFAYGVVTDAFNTGRAQMSYSQMLAMDATQRAKNALALNLHYSINVLESYFHFHHLLLAVYQKYYSILQPVVENKCTNFIKQSEHRMKKYVPNLGEMMVWLTLNNITWDEACPALLDELFVRHVKWVLQECPELYKISNKQSCIRLRKTFQHSTTSLRLYMFQYFFLKWCCEIGAMSPLDKLREYNDNFGCPPAELPSDLQKWCRRIYKVTDWIGFFQLIETPCPSAKALSKWLEYAVIESDHRGYHKNCDVDLLADLKKCHFQNAEKLFRPNQLNDRFCLCAEEVNGLPEMDSTLGDGSSTSKKVIFADIMIIKYVGFRWGVNDKKIALRTYPKNASELQQEVNRLLDKLQLDMDENAANIRYKLIVSNQSEYNVDGSKWVKDLNACFKFDDDVNIQQDEQWRQRTKRDFYLWDKDAKYHYDMMRQHGIYRSRYFKITQNEYGWNGKAHEWRPAAQKYIIDLDVLEIEDNNDENLKPLVLPFSLLNTDGIGEQHFNLDEDIKADDSIYYITVPQILTFQSVAWEEWILSPYSVNLDGLVNELQSIYASFQQRKALPIIAELFEDFKKRNANLAANANATNIFKFFQEDCRRGRKKNKIISKHFPGSLLWYQPHNKSVESERPICGLSEDFEEYKKRVRIWEMSPYVCAKTRLNLKYENAMYCGETVKFHKWCPQPKKPWIKEYFYEIKPLHPKHIPTDYILEEWLATDENMKQYNYDIAVGCDEELDENGNALQPQKHVAIQQYAAMAVPDALVCTVLFQRGYHLNISEILPFHAKHSQILPIQQMDMDEELMNKYLNKRRRLRIDGFGEAEIIQFAVNRKGITEFIYKEKLKRAMDFMKARAKTEQWEDVGCVYRRREYSDYCAHSRGAIKYDEILPDLGLPLFDPFESTHSFLTKNNYSPQDPDNVYNPEFDALAIQSYDVSTHRWFNAKIEKFQSLSAMIIYEGWNKFVFRDKVSLCSNNLAPFNTYLIEDDVVGFVDYEKGPSHYSVKDYTEEYEAKQRKQSRLDEKFKLVNDEYYHKYFFEAVTDNNLRIVKQLLFVGREPQETKRFDGDEKKEINIKKEKHKQNNNKVSQKNKWIAFDWNESVSSDEEDININNDKDNNNKDTDWLKWMTRKIDVNMTDINGRTPLFASAYNGYWKMCKLLMQYDIDVDIVDLDGQTAFDYAKAGLQNAKSEKTVKQYNQIMNKLKTNMKILSEGVVRPAALNNNNNNNNKITAVGHNSADNMAINPGNGARRSVNNDEIIWSSSLIYIGNLPWKMSEVEIKEFVLKYGIKTLQVIKKSNYTLIRTREDLNRLSLKIDKMNATFFRGAMITVNLFQQQRRNNKYNNSLSKARSLAVMDEDEKDNDNPGGVSLENGRKEKEFRTPTANRALFVTNFDVLPGIYDNLNEVFVGFGALQSAIQIGVDKFGDPYAKIIFDELQNAVRAYEKSNTLNCGIKIGLRTLRVEYSKFAPIAKQRYYTNNNNNNNTYDGGYVYNGNNIRPQRIRPQNNKSNRDMLRERGRGRGRNKEKGIRDKRKKNGKGKGKQRKVKKSNNNNNGNSDGWITKGGKGKNKKWRKSKK